MFYTRLNQSTYRATSVFHSEFLSIDKVKQSVIFLFFNAAEGVHNATLRFHFKVKGTSASATASEIDTSDLIESLKKTQRIKACC